MKFQKITIENFETKLNELKLPFDTTPIFQAVELAKESHFGQMRESGEPYINHCLGCCYILAEMKMDTSLLVAGILHDVLEDTKITFSDIKKEFGEDIAHIVEGVTKISDYHFTQGENFREKQAENFRKLLISITKDIRIIIVKLADRLHNLRTIEYLKRDKQLRVCRETLYIYAPLANRFGLVKIKNECEDRALRCLEPTAYKRIFDIVAMKKEVRESYIKRHIVEPLACYIKKNEMSANILSRTKHFYSIWRKHTVRGVAYDEIFDLYAIRILLTTKEECYRVFGLVHAFFKPLNIVKDYIANPKLNGYMSLHTIVIGPLGKKIEVQIRTYKMDKIAAEGVAAHWMYKENTDYSRRGLAKQLSEAEKQNSIRGHIKSIRDFLTDNLNKKSGDFLENLRLDLYPDIVIVLTPAGELINLPQGATPIDFAFHIHTQVGSRCLGCRINGKMSPIRSVLRSGDRVEIITSKHDNIAKDWLKYAKTSRAKSKIRSFIRHKEVEDAIELGKQIFDKKSRKFHIKAPKEKDVLDIARIFNFNNVPAFYAAIGKGNLLFSTIRTKYEAVSSPQSSVAKKRVYKPTIGEASAAARVLEKIKGITVDGQSNLMISYAKCCNPIPGDKIVGYTTKGRGITIHRQSCSDSNFNNLFKKVPERMIDVEWDYSFKNKFKPKNSLNVRMEITATDRNNLLLEIIGHMAKWRVSIYKSHNTLEKENLSKLVFFFYIDTQTNLLLLKKSITDVAGVMEMSTNRVRKC